MMSENYGNQQQSSSGTVLGTGGLGSPKNKIGDLTPYSNHVQFKKAVSFGEGSNSQ